MADTTTQEWPDQRLKILVPGMILMIISTFFVIWRVVYGIKGGRSFMICDYLLIIATLLNISAAGTSWGMVNAGLGRHIMDPSIDIMRYAYLLYISQVLNIIAVAILKWSICAWLLILNFSKLYQGVVWLSILMVTAFNFLAPVLTLFGCSPFEANWNPGYPGKKKCWAKGTLELSYTQGVSNVITDVVYMAAPLIYLSRIQLSKRTQWGIRIVFLLSIPVTVCSIFKTVELKAITKTQDPTWDGVNLSVWSQSELSLGILIASLPPLRKAFDRFFQRIIPSTQTGSHPLPHYGYGHSTSGNIKMGTFQSKRATHSRLPGESVIEGDDESDRAILEDDEGKGSGIMKTTKVTVVESEGSSHKGSQRSYKQSNDWASPNHDHGNSHAV